MGFYRVGYCRVDITPTESVPLAGIGRSSQRMSRCVRDPLYASCFAITDETGKTVILMTMDLQRGLSRTVDKVRAAVTERFGIPADCIIYVPYSADHSILESYKTASNWSTYASYMQEEPQ